MGGVLDWLDDWLFEPIVKADFDESKIKRYPAGVAVDEASGAGGGRFAPADSTFGPNAMATMGKQFAVVATDANGDPLRRTDLSAEAMTLRDIVTASDAMDNHAEAMKKKAALQRHLNEQLTPDEIALLNEAYPGGGEWLDGAGKVVKQWAYKSGDHEPLSVMIQHAVQSEFGLDAEMGHMGPPHWSLPEGSTIRPELEPTLRKVVRLMYEDTQKRLADAGVTEMILFRGVKEGGPGRTKMPGPDGWSIQEHTTQPASSFSISPTVAVRFTSGSDSGAVVAARVPAREILSFPTTGFGALNEGEVVTLGTKRKYFQFKSQASAGGSALVAFERGVSILLGLESPQYTHASDRSWWAKALKK